MKYKIAKLIWIILVLWWFSVVLQSGGLIHMWGQRDVDMGVSRMDIVGINGFLFMSSFVVILIFCFWCIGMAGLYVIDNYDRWKR